MTRWIVAVDPGREKCGYAVFDGVQLVKKDVVARSDIMDQIRPWLRYQSVLVVGDRTGSKKFVSEFKEKFAILKMEIVSIDEHLTSQEGKDRYWRENPARGFYKLVPKGLRVPPVPIDDHVAVILAERYFQSYGE